MLSVHLHLVHTSFDRDTTRGAYCRLDDDRLKDIEIGLSVVADGIAFSRTCYTDFGDADTDWPTNLQLMEMLRPPPIQRAVVTALGPLEVRHFYDAVNAELTRAAGTSPISLILQDSLRALRPVKGGGTVVEFSRPAR